MREYKAGASVVRLARGDITRIETDAIVNAANAALAGGGGVDGAIHRAGGPRILEECRKIGGCETGSAVITAAGDLAAKAVIHAVGPRWSGGSRGEESLLASAYRKCLDLAREHGHRRIAFPSISTGAYGYPVEAAARVALRTVATFLRGVRDAYEVTFVLFDDRTLLAFEGALDELAAS